MSALSPAGLYTDAGLVAFASALICPGNTTDRHCTRVVQLARRQRLRCPAVTKCISLGARATGNVGIVVPLNNYDNDSNNYYYYYRVVVVPVNSATKRSDLGTDRPSDHRHKSINDSGDIYSLRELDG